MQTQHCSQFLHTRQTIPAMLNSNYIAYEVSFIPTECFIRKKLTFRLLFCSLHQSIHSIHKTLLRCLGTGLVLRPRQPVAYVITYHWRHCYPARASLITTFQPPLTNIWARGEGSEVKTGLTSTEQWMVYLISGWDACMAYTDDAYCRPTSFRVCTVHVLHRMVIVVSTSLVWT